MRYILLFLVAIFAYSKTMIATYDAKYGIFGTIATAKGVFEKNETNYVISTTSKAEGIAATLSKHMVQKYISKGIVKNGQLIPQTYISYRKKGDTTYKRVYVFDHKNRKIYRYKYKNGKFEIKETMPYYTPDDVLSLYFNLPYYFKKLGKRNLYVFYALGGRKSDGRVDVTFPSGDELKELKSTFKNAKGIYIKGNLYNKVFAGDKGILYLVIDPQNWVTVAGMVKNVLKIGNLKGKITSLKIKE